MESKTWDIFCRVVDNYGDVGVSWRLARLIAREHGKRVRLWLDDLTVLAKLRPEIDPGRDVQTLEQVQVARIRDPFDDFEVADVVLETFGCDPPEAYVHAMAKRAEKPRWINLEYLSAEDWVEGSHALPSPNPRLPLTKHFFFPGFTPRTGGLLREESVLRRRDEFQRDPGTQAAFGALVGGRPRGNAQGEPLQLFGRTGGGTRSRVRGPSGPRVARGARGNRGHGARGMAAHLEARRLGAHLRRTLPRPGPL